MFSNMKLATKMAFGFGTVVLLIVVLSIVAWTGLDGLRTTAGLDRQGNACLDQLNRCATLRRDFSMHGFEVQEGQDANAADLWKKAHAALDAQVAALRTASGLDSRSQQDLARVVGLSEAYGAAFGDQVAAFQQRDAAFKVWGEVGWGVTADIQSVIEKTIDPALAAAYEVHDVEQVQHWSTISDRLSKDVVQPFLLLRVTAVYLIATQADAQWEGYQAQFVKVHEGLGRWAKLAKGDTALEAVVAKLTSHFERYEGAGKDFYAGVLADRHADREMIAKAGELVRALTETNDRLHEQSEAISARTSMLITMVSIGAVVAGIFLAVLITRSIVKPIVRISASLNEGADQVNDAASQVSTASQMLAEGASEQASSLEETSSALEEVAAMTRTNADNARQANELSSKTREAANQGDQTMRRLNDAMAGINHSSQEISKIIKVIEEIAFQTNLLALNAAVEAARAGEHGRGFAVVADEVRNLAMRAATAAKETTALIEDAASRSRDGVSVAEEVGSALAGIVANVGKVTELINGIAKASEEQAQGVDQVNVAVSQMDKVTQQNAAGAEESASAAEELSAQSQTVKSMVVELFALIRGSAGAVQSQYDASTSTWKSPSSAKASPSPASVPKSVSKTVKASAAPAGKARPDDWQAVSSDDGFDGF